MNQFLSDWFPLLKHLIIKHKYSKPTILKWLRKGAILGLCNYSKKESLKRGRRRAWVTRKQQEQEEQSLQKEININE